MTVPNAKYISIWNDGETEVHTDVVVDFDDMCVIGWDEESKEYVGVVPVDDGALEALVEEKIISAFGYEFTAMSSDEYENFGRDDESYYDKYGNGIIVYNV